MSVTPELIAAVVSVAGSAFALVRMHMTRGQEKERVAEQVRAESREAFEELFREERQLRDAEREQHIAELERRDASHRAEIATIERESEARCAERVDVLRRFAHAEIERVEAKLAAAETRLAEAAEALARVPRIVREVARLVAQLDPYRTPTRTELARLREALALGGLTHSDINGLIAVRGVAT